MTYIQNLACKTNINNVPFKFQELILFGKRDTRRLIDQQLLYYLLSLTDAQSNEQYGYPYYTTVVIRGNDFEQTLFLYIEKSWYRAGIVKDYRPGNHIFNAHYNISRAKYHAAKSSADLIQRWQYGYNRILYADIKGYYDSIYL